MHTKFLLGVGMFPPWSSLPSQLHFHPNLKLGLLSQPYSASLQLVFNLFICFQNSFDFFLVLAYHFSLFVLQNKHGVLTMYLVLFKALEKY